MAEPLLGEVPSELDTDDTLSEAEDLAVVAENRPLDGEGVHAGSGTDALDLVSGNGDTDAGAADEETTVSLAGLDLAGCNDRKVGVG